MTELSAEVLFELAPFVENLRSFPLKDQTVVLKDEEVDIGVLANEARQHQAGAT